MKDLTKKVAIARMKMHMKIIDLYGVGAQLHLVKKETALYKQLLHCGIINNDILPVLGVKIETDNDGHFVTKEALS